MEKKAIMFSFMLCFFFSDRKTEDAVAIKISFPKTYMPMPIRKRPPVTDI